MRKSLVEMLRCPVDLSVLRLSVTEEVDEHIITGELNCAQCKRTYKIERGVPNMIPDMPLRVDGNDLMGLQSATQERFGFEWRYFRDWGWLEAYPEVPQAQEEFYGGLSEHTRMAFWSKSLFSEGDLHAGMKVLDAGCGNGRFTNEAAKSGAVVVGVDLGEGVYSAFEHTRLLPNVHIVRGDLFRLPFADETFQSVFSIGVLMHTGNAKEATYSLSRVVKCDGLLLVHVYGKGRRGYEFLDALIRSITTRLSIQNQMRFANVTASLARRLRKGGPLRSRIHRWVFSYINLLPTEHHMFDWWSAPIATHHTMDEVLDWFKDKHLQIIRTNPPLNNLLAERNRRMNHAAITVLGKRSE